MSGKVIAGPAGHWYALIEDWQFGGTLLGLPMSADEDESKPPQHPGETVDFGCAAGWYQITDPAPGVDDDEIRAELRSYR